MTEIKFEWNQSKNRANQRKHGVSFEEASSVFSDENALLIADPDHSTVEDRFILLGFSQKMRHLVVCHCDREPESTIRIISARRATKPEQQEYHKRISS